ncbi:M23 family metallopeptidase [Anaerorhabdus furcosa]|uniref:Murein DD-endopeptidase MepM and murein hydrolase activator NlpD, contain LysM domain n=1 Tax=Anaerorhabdus furcosa TaxID=118967 RepID=A0A1T4K5A5_9FIRM|nr:M23 family metallopeptidase [Anaerorhabdus furcosa]SJZ37609.1 Murein DD-endopeptidase MepM and murein hydrolase activator NlpD, contain LysM domain [Anaerorhabdus furcosa]
MKKVLPLVIAALASLAIVFLLPQFFDVNSVKVVEAKAQIEKSILPQEVIGVRTEPKEITKIYDSGVLVGVLNDDAAVSNLLTQVYTQEYESKFPGTHLDTGNDIYEIKELSYNDYQNIDDQITQYLKEKNSYTVQVNAIDFADENGVFATIYVDDVKKYEEALHKYLMYFVEESSLNAITSNETVPALTTYGERDMSVEILQNISMKKAYASPDKIMTSTNEILDYLKWGEGVEKQYYTVVPGDTIQGVGSKNNFLSDKQVVNINDDILSSVDQVLSPGTQLNVTYFQSPIDVVVKKESLRKRDEEPGPTIYQEDASMYTNEEEVVQEAKVGSKNSLIEETWINGVIVSGEEVSSIITMQPQQEIIRVGTLEVPGNGTGTFRYPIDNPLITCRWGCYSGHRALDVQNPYNRYGPVYAADRGTVYEVGYTGINGNYMIIDHGNTGYRTYYGHMNKPTDLKVGDRVDKGDVIGQIGMTGKASGPHVHFFIIVSATGERRDPCAGFLAC